MKFTEFQLIKKMTWYFDSHIHLSDPQYSPDMDFILQEMNSLKIKACCVSMDVQNSLETLELAKKSDLEQAQSRLSLADYNLTVEGSNLHDMEAKYQRLVGTLPPKDLDNNIQINKDIPKDALSALTKAQQNNPALVASFEDVQQQASMRNVKVSAFMPRVDFKAFKDANINSNGVYGDFRKIGRAHV